MNERELGAESEPPGRVPSPVARRASDWVLRVMLSYFALPVTALATGPLLSRTLGPAQRGELAALLMPIALMPTLLSFGLQDAATVLVARGRLSVRQAVRIGSPAAATSGTAAFTLLWFAAPLLLRSHPQGIQLLRLGSLTLIGELWFNVIRGAALGRGRFELANGERWLGALSRFVVLVTLAVLGHLTITTAFWTTVGSSLLGALVLLLALRGSSAVQVPQSAHIWTLTSFGLRSWVGGLAGQLNARLDQSVLLPFIGAAALGQYAVAVTLATVTNYFAGAVRDVLLTRVAHGGGVLQAARVTRMLLILVGSVALLGALTAPITVPLLFGNDFRPAIGLAQVLFLGSIPAALNASLSAGLTAGNKPGRVSIAETAALAVTVIGLVTLVRPLGALGAALTSVLSYAVTTAGLLFWYSRRCDISLRQCLVPDSDDVRWLVRELIRVRQALGRFVT
jgi:O-antigen/teichoic acid export membrane protein